jgi:hypothetical protein
LGQAVKGGAREGGFDQRLFNQAAGMDAGFAAEDGNSPLCCSFLHSFN